MKKYINLVLCLILIFILSFGFSGCSNIANLIKKDQTEETGILLDASTFVSDDGKAFRFNFCTCAEGNFNRSTGTVEAENYYVFSAKANQLILYPLAISPVLTIDWNNPTVFDKKGDPVKSFDKYKPFDGYCEIEFSSEKEKEMFNDANFFDWFSIFESRNQEVSPPSFEATPIDYDTGPKVANSFIEKDMYYARSTLTDNEKAFYDAIYDAIYQMKNKTPDLSKYSISEERASDIKSYIHHDCPELFWWNGSWSYYTSGKTVSSIVFKTENSSSYNYSIEQKEQIQKNIDAAADKILSNVTDNMSEYEKVKYIYTELGKSITYNKQAAEAIKSSSDTTDNSDQSIVGGLVESKAVCAGISRALQYLLHNVGINCFYVSGTGFDILGGTGPEPHGWNMIFVDGDWYYADLTTGLDSIKRGIPVDFLKTEERIKVLASFEYLGDLEDETDDKNVNPPLPVCNSERFDYINLEGATFDSFDDSTLGIIKNYFADALVNKKRELTFIFTSAESAQKAEDVFNGKDTSGSYPSPRQITADLKPVDGIGIFYTDAVSYEYNPNKIEVTIRLLYQKTE